MLNLIDCLFKEMNLKSFLKNARKKLQNFIFSAKYGS